MGSSAFTYKFKLFFLQEGSVMKIDRDGEGEERNGGLDDVLFILLLICEDFDVQFLIK